MNKKEIEKFDNDNKFNLLQGRINNLNSDCLDNGEIIKNIDINGADYKMEIDIINVNKPTLQRIIVLGLGGIIQCLERESNSDWYNLNSEICKEYKNKLSKLLNLEV